jgi:hypothetical protein
MVINNFKGTTMIYEIKAYQQYITYDKCWIEVEASSPEEALALVKKDPEAYDILDSKCVDISNTTWEDLDEWKVTNVRPT